MSDIRDRFIRHVETPIAPTETGRPKETRQVPNAKGGFYRPALPEGFKDIELSNAWTSVDAIRDDLRRKVDAIWQSEPSVGVALTPAQKHEWRKSEVKRVVEAELEGRLKLVKPVVESARKALAARREKLTAKGSVELDGIPAQRALMIADHFGKLDLERRVLMALEAMNDSSVPENRELLQAIAWSHPALEVVPAGTRARIQGVLVAASDPDEYSNVTQLDTAIQATSESLGNLETWAASLADEH